jgi:hypothetical protein
MMAVAMAKRQNLTIARGLLPPDASAQISPTPRGDWQKPSSRPSGRDDLCKILQANFGEFHFHALR